MKFTCERDELIKDISLAQDIIASKNALSILANVLLVAKDSKLTIRATDLKVGFETSSPVEVSREGATTVFCDKLLGILRSLPSGAVEFELDEHDSLHIRTVFKKINFTLKTISPDKYPEMPLHGDSYFSIPQSDLLEMISHTVFAVSDDETRYFMNGVFVEKGEKGLTMVATDGRRLAYIEKEVDGGVPDFNGVIIPPKILHLARKLLPGEGMVDFAIGEKHVFLRYGDVYLSSNLIEGNFPAYRRVIPEQQAHSFTLQREEFLEALRRVSLLVEQKSRRVFLTVKEGVLVVRSEETDLGVAQEEIPAQYADEEVTIAVNYLYLLEPLKVMTEEQVEIAFTEPSRAITVRPVPEREFFHIVMPMQLD
ncbi:DNA polymerase III, beta subunit [Spirochaeta thermophila DSM 6578]|uniref:Beta sliding clamp n=1 Tax=Winmispira thermophila (strain ATCC 700085 / DSM 6578 / Z-1203) TaxID=869211 RepID=G0GAY7_WINT7|nr:DNA polymerase III subunit beta [Spirochaeta thermophila]AEJ60289.1 DNA polymerase III, beta subunit [Spirochaeta thermophila DSM 6578]